MTDACASTRVFKNLQLSYRGSERQAPSILTLALMFSRAMGEAAEAGRHNADWNTEQRLRAIVASFHATEGTIAKWHICEDKFRAIHNLLVGTSPGSRKVITSHLNHFKWKESAFNADLLRSTRWLINATPKGAKDPFRRILVVNATIQEKFLLNHVAYYVSSTRKVKASSKSKFRPSVKEWDDVVSYTAVMCAVKEEMESYFDECKTSTEKRDKAFEDLETCFMARLGVNSQFSCWDIGEVEEATAVALFHEIKTKIAADETLWARYQHSLVKKAAREHIVSVQHAKTQNSIGMGLVEKFMEKACNINLLQDMANVPNLDAWLKQAAIEQKVKQDQLYVVVLTDYTKAGILSTHALNKHSSLMAKLTNRNQKRNSAIEEKMSALHVELRNVYLGIDVGGLHGNSDRPGFYSAWIAVSDGFLPLKGTAHRAVRGDNEAIKPTAVNEFTSSSLWRLQGFADGFPTAVPAQEFHIPSARSHLAGHDCRRNLTDSQETAQWVSGEDCMGPKPKDSGDNVKYAAVVHTTPYCGSLERACMKMKIPVLSITDNQVNHTYTVLTVGSALMEDWKHSRGSMANLSPKYQEQPQDPNPVQAIAPELALCKLQENKLTVPEEIRSQFMGDPCRSSEWRKLLAEFDRKWSGSGQGHVQGQASEQEQGQGTETNEGEGAGQEGAGTSLWDTAFQDEPQTVSAFEAKYQAVHTFVIDDNLAGVIVEGPKLFVKALGEVEWTSCEPILFYGAGTWLLDQKASSFLEAWVENPRKAYVFEFQHDRHFVVLEAWFEINVKDCMVWKPSAVQLRNVKNKNCGSYFDAKVIHDSPVVQQAIGVAAPDVSNREGVRSCKAITFLERVSPPARRTGQENLVNRYLRMRSSKH
eukprot:s2591_g10.t1